MLFRSVVGGARGIGLAVAEAWAALGYDVTVVGRRPPASPGLRFLEAELADVTSTADMLVRYLAGGAPRDVDVAVQEHGQHLALRREHRRLRGRQCRIRRQNDMRGQLYTGVIRRFQQIIRRVLDCNGSGCGGKVQQLAQ